MRHCNTSDYYPRSPGYTTPAARRQPAAFREDALERHIARLPLWISWDDEFVTRVQYAKLPALVVVTRCRGGHLNTVVHLANEPYPRP